MNFIPAVAYHFCLNLPTAFTQPGASTLADLCMVILFQLKFQLLFLFQFDLLLSTVISKTVLVPKPRQALPHILPTSETEVHRMVFFRPKRTAEPTVIPCEQRWMRDYPILNRLLCGFNHALKEGAAGINVIIALSYLFSHLLLYDLALHAHFDNLQ